MHEEEQNATSLLAAVLVLALSRLPSPLFVDPCSLSLSVSSSVVRLGPRPRDSLRAWPSVATEPRDLVPPQVPFKPSDSTLIY